MFLLDMFWNTEVSHYVYLRHHENTMWAGPNMRGTKNEAKNARDLLTADTDTGNEALQVHAISAEEGN